MNLQPFWVAKTPTVRRGTVKLDVQTRQGGVDERRQGPNCGGHSLHGDRHQQSPAAGRLKISC